MHIHTRSEKESTSSTSSTSSTTHPLMHRIRVAIGLETPSPPSYPSPCCSATAQESGGHLDRETLLQFEQIIPVLRKTIGSKRFFHSLGAMHYAVALADRHGEDLVRAATAGLLHDCGRLPAIEQVEAEARRRGLDVPAEDRPYAKVWHAWLSTHIAEHDFGIADPSVLQAILYHPTGEAEMSRLDKVIFLADYLEPTRRFEELKQLRELAQQDLDSAYQRALETKIRYIQSRGRPLHPRSLRALASVGISLAGA